MAKNLLIIFFTILFFGNCTKTKDEAHLSITINELTGVTALPADGATYAKVTSTVTNDLQEGNFISFSTTNGMLYSSDFLTSVNANTKLLVKANNKTAICYLKTSEIIDSNVFITCNLNGIVKEQKVIFNRVYPDDFNIEVSDKEPDTTQNVIVDAYFFKKENNFFHSALPVSCLVYNIDSPTKQFTYPSYVSSSKIDGKEKASFTIKNFDKTLGSTRIIISCNLGNQTIKDSLTIIYK